MFLKDHLDWCCNILGDYPDVIPFKTWGSLVDKEIRTKWEQKECNQAVGGKSKKNCKGIE